MIFAFPRIFGRALLTLFMLTGCVFIALRLTGDPAALILGPEADAEALAGFRVSRGLDKPLYQQYFRYIKDLAVLDFGVSYVTGIPAREAFVEALGKTMKLMLPTAMVTLLLGIPLGVWAALKRGRAMDRGLMFFSVLGFAVPNFFFGLLLILFFTVFLGWLPSYGDADGWHYIMPVLTIATSEAAIFSRMARGAMLDSLNMPCVKAARTRGLPNWRIIWLHALPNALISLLTMAGFFLGALTAGAVITENIFSWPGTGRLLVISVANRDIPTVQMVVLGIGASLITANLAMDLLSLLANPRLRDAAR
ncbi:MAG: ABC transporter permease [Candidatus Adiutrix sp.]|nr:ABC transporter permease [Candidatus Adiutrix sp.]